MKHIDASAIAQIAIIVRDIEKSASAWAELLGIPVPEIVTMANDEYAKTEYMGKPSKAIGRGAFFQMGPIQMELIQPIGEPSTWNDFLRDRGEGVHHIAFWMKDQKTMVDARALLASKGMSLIQQGGWNGGEYAYFDSVRQLGAIVELLAPDK